MENVHSFHMGRSECGEEPGESFLGRLPLSPADGWMASQSGPARPGLTLLTSLRQSVTLPPWRGGDDVIQLPTNLTPRGRWARGGRGVHQDPRRVPGGLRGRRWVDVVCVGDGVGLGWVG